MLSNLNGLRIVRGKNCDYKYSNVIFCLLLGLRFVCLLCIPPYESVFIRLSLFNQLRLLPSNLDSAIACLSAAPSFFLAAVL